MNYTRKNLYKIIGSSSLFFLLILGFAFSVSAQEPGQSEKAAVSGESSQWQVLATSPGVQVIIENQGTPGFVLTDNEIPLDAAYNWLASKGLEEGRNLFKGKLLYVSVGAAAVNARPSEPDYIDSRYMAFQRAELESKAKTALYLGVDLSTERGSSEREINPEERAALKQIYEASKEIKSNAKQAGISDRIQSIFDKATILAEAKLDKALIESGVDPKPKKKKQSGEEAKKQSVKNLRNVSETSLKASASAFTEVQGTQVIQTFEGSYHKNYQVVVITLWSQNLQKLVDSMISGKSPRMLDPTTAKGQLISQLPAEDSQLACLSGVRAYINQRGERTILAFGQAGVINTGGREDKAFMRAHKKGRLRAMAALRSFMGETVAFTATEQLQEVLALYANEANNGKGMEEYKSISQFEEIIQAEAEKQKIIGVHGIFSKELKHPFTDRPMVLQVMAWSPASQELAKDVKSKIENKTMDEVEEEIKNSQQRENIKGKEGLESSGEGADMDAL